ncbi:MAG: dihydrofolate reductase family protein [Myxococcales bacterium]
MRTRFAVFIAASVDGYIAGPDGGLDWLKPFEGQEHGYTAFYESVDAVVIGRGTYDVVLTFPGWAYGKKRVIVCTRRPASPSHGEEITREEPRALAERLDREGVRRVYVDGGALIRSFLREGLVHEMTISVIPVILGAGIPLFADGLPERRLRLIDARTYASGLVQLRYTL